MTARSLTHRLARSFSRPFSLALVLSLGVAASACGDDDSGLGDRKISSLSPAELEDVCASDRESVTPAETEALARVLCIAFASQFGECTPEAVDACVADFLSSDEPAPGEPEGEATCELGFDPATCDVTVDQLLACSAAQRQQILDVAPTLTCESADQGGEPSLPAACAIVEERCPRAGE